MSSQDVLDQVASVLQAVPEIKTALKYRTSFVDPQDFPVAMVWIDQQDEWREGLGGSRGGGVKLVNHRVVIEVASVASSNEQYQPIWYALIDAIRFALAANQSLSNTVRRFGEDISISLDPPAATNETWQYRAEIRSTAQEARQA